MRLLDLLSNPITQQPSNSVSRRLPFPRRSLPSRSRPRARRFRRAAAFAETAAERFHDVDDFAAFLLFFFLRLDRLAFRLGADAVQQALAVFILEGEWI